MAGARRFADPARRRAPRAGGGLRGGRVRAGERERRRRARHDRPGAANTLGAIGEAWASRSPVGRDRHRHPHDPAPRGRAPRRAARVPDQRGDVRAGDEGGVHAADVRRARVAPRSARPRRRSPRPQPPGLPRDPDRPARRGAGEEPATPAGAGASARARRRAGARPASRRARATAGMGRRRRGGGRARARPSARSPSASARRSSRPTRPRPARRRAPCTSGCRRTCRRSGALWDEADVVVAVGSDLDGMMTQNWRQPPPPRLRGDQRRRGRRGEELRARRDRRAATRATRARRCAAERPARATPGSTLRRAWRRGRARAPARRVPGRAALPRRVRRAPCPTTAVVVVRHVHPRLLARRVPPRAGAAAAGVPDGLGDARLRVPRGARRGAGGRRPGRVGLAATAASCSRAASSRRSRRSACRSPR